MPSYQVLEKGFYEGAMYEPNGKRQVVTTDKPMKDVPHWLQLIDEKAATTAARKKAEAKQITEANEKKINDTNAVTDVDFTNGSNVVETL